MVFLEGIQEVPNTLNEFHSPHVSTYTVPVIAALGVIAAIACCYKDYTQKRRETMAQSQKHLNLYCNIAFREAETARQLEAKNGELSARITADRERKNQFTSYAEDFKQEHNNWSNLDQLTYDSFQTLLDSNIQRSTKEHTDVDEKLTKARQESQSYARSAALELEFQDMTCCDRVKYATASCLGTTKECFGALITEASRRCFGS